MTAIFENLLASFTKYSMQNRLNFGVGKSGSLQLRQRLDNGGYDSSPVLSSHLIPSFLQGDSFDSFHCTKLEWPSFIVDCTTNLESLRDKAGDAGVSDFLHSSDHGKMES